VSGNQDIQPPDQGGLLYQPTDWLLDCSFVEENAPALALGALEPDEATRINHHISWCPGCAKLVHESRKAANYLPFLSPQASPSALVKSALFARIESLQLLEQADPKELWSGIPSTQPVSSFEAAAVTRRRSFLGVRRKGSAPARRRVNWELIVAPLAAVPLVVALAIVGGWALKTQDRLDSQVAFANDLEDQNADAAWHPEAA